MTTGSAVPRRTRARAAATATVGGTGGGPLIDSVADWLMARALADTPLEDLLAGCCERLTAAGVPLLRGHVAFRTLHPLFDAATVTWRRDAPVRTIQVPHAEAGSEEWNQSPHKWMIDRNIPLLRRRLTGPEAQCDFPMLEHLRAGGGTDYLAYLVAFEDRLTEERPLMGIVGSWTTDRETGFSDDDVRALTRIQQRLAVAIKVTMKDQIARNILGAYLGGEAGRQVLEGRIRLGDGQTVHAVVWYNDLRESTAMADRMAPDDFLTLLNGYFACTAGAVLAHGGEVLRFVGDAVLAIFPIAGTDGDAAACGRALAAAREARRRLGAFNHARRVLGQEAIDFGLGLHVGDVIFGNIGVPERIEFSVIGPAANAVARIENLTKELGQPILASAAVAGQCPGDWRLLGRHPLRGVAGPVDVFVPAAEGETTE